MIYPNDDWCGRDDMLLTLVLFIIIYYFTFGNINFTQCLVRVWEDSKSERASERASDRDLLIGKCHQQH